MRLLLVAVTAEVNIALGRPAFMSSVFDVNRAASRGNDGNNSTNFHTKSAPRPHWWAVDFGLERSRVARVRVTNVPGWTYYRKYNVVVLFSWLAYLFGLPTDLR